MDACPVIRISPLAAIGLWLALSGSLGAQNRFQHSVEPPLADGGDGAIQLAAAQMPAGPLSMATVGVPIVRVNVLAASVVPSNKNVTYRLHIENSSNMPASNVRIIHPLNGVRLVQSEPKPVNQESQELEWAIGKLEGGDQRTIDVTVSPPVNMEEFNAVAKVRFEHGRQIKIRLSKVDLSMRLVMQRDVQQFDIVPARLEINNPSPIEVKDVQVTASLPDGVIFHVEPTGTQPPEGVTPAKTKSFSIARIGPYETQVVNFKVVGVETGRVNLSAYVGQAATPERDTKCELNVLAPQLELTATGPTSSLAQQATTYRVTIKNGGTNAMRNVTVADRLPAQCQFVAASDGGQSFEEEVQWILTILQPGETRTLELTVKQQASGTVTHRFVATYRQKFLHKDVSTVVDPERRANQF